MITLFSFFVFDCSELHVRVEDIGEHIERQKQVLREATAKHQVSHIHVHVYTYVHDKKDAICFQIVDFLHMAKPAHGLVISLASFSGSPLAPTKNKNGGGEPGFDSHVISRHDAFALAIETSLT